MLCHPFMKVTNNRCHKPPIALTTKVPCKKNKVYLVENVTSFVIY